jgi:hypothetical protein
MHEKALAEKVFGLCMTMQDEPGFPATAVLARLAQADPSSVGQFPVAWRELLREGRVTLVDPGSPYLYRVCSAHKSKNGRVPTAAAGFPQVPERMRPRKVPASKQVMPRRARKSAAHSAGNIHSGVSTISTILTS